MTPSQLGFVGGKAAQSALAAFTSSVLQSFDKVFSYFSKAKVRKYLIKQIY